MSGAIDGRTVDPQPTPRLAGVQSVQGRWKHSTWRLFNLRLFNHPWLDPRDYCVSAVSTPSSTTFQEDPSRTS